MSAKVHEVHNLAVTICKLPEDGVLTPKHVGVILVLILYYLHVQLLV